MNQSIEDVLLTTLQNAANQSDISKVKEAEHNLALFETEPKFYTALLNVYVNRELDFSIRYIAILT
jgi:Importin-beta N-terminal domain